MPGASRDVIAGWLGDALKVRVSAPPERGRANAAVCRLIADALDLPGSCVRIVAGSTAPRKILEIDGLSAEELRARLQEPDPDQAKGRSTVSAKDSR